MPIGMAKSDFTVPVTAGNYAPEIIYLKQDDRTSPKGFLDAINSLTLVIETLTATAQVEVDLLKPGGDARNAGDWIIAAKAHTTAGLKDPPTLLASWLGARIRVKSGGTAGTSTVDAVWS